MRVLLIDPAGTGLNRLRRLLEEAGHEVHLARPGAAAMDRTRDLGPDVVIFTEAVSEKERTSLTRDLRRHNFSGAIITVTDAPLRRIDDVSGSGCCGTRTGL